LTDTTEQIGGIGYWRRERDEKSASAVTKANGFGRCRYCFIYAVLSAPWHR
jgi:hypothetical protein